MSRALAIVVVVVLIAAAAAAYAGTARAVMANSTPEDNTTDETPVEIDPTDPEAIMDRGAIETNQADDNVVAFLALIAWSEGTDKAADPYRVCYGYKHTVQNFADHPRATGEWGGESLASLGPSYAGKVSTAAGRYQIINPTWQGIKKALSLPDFGPDSQDKAAVYLIRGRKALDDVKAGNIAAAVAKCAPEWASLPGANAAGQHMRKLDDLLAVYEQSGGALA